ncbi:MAG: beta-galactosidase [Clostridia bacterium]|nr:beta-galactosidase [Clostridia bacterium]MBQ5793556.1 beta-galactosidase [Clostridia bacterium]
MQHNIPRAEYPRPQLVRNAWLNLNGTWEYMTDRGNSGEMRGFAGGAEFTEQITVPFCRESVLSGIGDTDFCNCVWYRKKLTLPADWQGGKRVLLHIGACDYKTDVWVNGKWIDYHIGGYVAFTMDITKALVEGENAITIRAIDDLRTGNQPAGKQSPRYESFGCFYTRTTGIWQTVWLECVPEIYLQSARYFTDIDDCTLTAELHVKGGEDTPVSLVASYEGKVVGTAKGTAHGGKCTLRMALDELHLWEVGNGRLYDLEITCGDDVTKSYFGMRCVECRKGMMYLNHKPVFQRLVLDQGFYPDGIYTAPTVEELYADVDRSMAMGFNGARLHQKVFEPLFLSYCDKKGYIVWGEHANWVQDSSRTEIFENFLPEWQEIMERDFNHPAIIGWCPINESTPNQNRLFMKSLAALTRGYDPTRLYIDASGWVHQDELTDIFDLHDYEQNPEEFAKHLAPLANGEGIEVHAHLLRHNHDEKLHCVCNCTFVSEYGGTQWVDAEKNAGWGYGQAPIDEQEFKYRFKGLSEAILFHPNMGGLCYTQLTDVEQEVNGLYTYDRRAKFPPEFFRSVLTQKAAIEQE